MSSHCLRRDYHILPIVQLFFAPYRSPTTGAEILPPTREFSCENVDGFIAPGKDKALRKRAFTVTGLGMPPVSFSETGKPSADGTALRALAGSPFSKTGMRAMIAGVK
jgi:hypothetical protein